MMDATGTVNHKMVANSYRVATPSPSPPTHSDGALTILSTATDDLIKCICPPGLHGRGAPVPPHRPHCCLDTVASQLRITKEIWKTRPLKHGPSPNTHLK